MNRVTLRPLFRNSLFKLGFRKEGEDFSAVTVHLSLTHVRTGARVELADADATRPDTDEFYWDETPEWTAAHLVEGEWEALVFVNRAAYVWLVFEVKTPTGGEVTPP